MSLLVQGCVSDLHEPDSSDALVFTRTPSHNCFSGEEIEPGRVWLISDQYIYVSEISMAKPERVIFRTRLSSESRREIENSLTSLSSEFWSGNLIPIEDEWWMNGYPSYRCEITGNPYGRSVIYDFPPCQLGKTVALVNRHLPGRFQIDWKLYDCTPEIEQVAAGNVR